ncbi:hypothetical protein LCGC14_2785060, partial [marine sediment metagenome]
MDRIEEVKKTLEGLYWLGRENAKYPINGISVQPELEIINQLYEPQPDHTSECIKHKTIFGSVGCTCKPDQSSRLLTEKELHKAFCAPLAIRYGTADDEAIR